MFSLKDEKKWIRVTLWVLLALYLCISVSAIFIYDNYFLLGSMDKMDNDDVKYVRSAVTLLEKGMLTYHDPQEPTIFIMPGITIALAPFIKIFGIEGGMTAFRIFQAFLQALSIMLIFFIGRRLFSSTVGIVASVIDILYIPEVYNAGTILTEVIFKFLLLLLVYVSLYALQTKNARYYMVGGGVLGLACLFRPTIAMFPALILVMWLLKRYTLKDMLKLALVTVSAFVLVMSPWWVRNYIAFKSFIPLTVSSGNPFLQGTYIDYDQTVDYTPLVRELGDDAVENAKIEMDTGIYRLKIKLREEPLKYLYWYTIGKSYYLWVYPYYMKGILGVSMLSARVFHYFIIACGILGFIISMKKRNKLAILLMLTVLYFNAVHLPYFTYSRYIYPAIPFLIIFSGYWSVSIYHMLIRKFFRKEVMSLAKH